jgi:hypothetical protein
MATFKEKYPETAKAIRDETRLYDFIDYLLRNERFPALDDLAGEVYRFTGISIAKLISEDQEMVREYNQKTMEALRNENCSSDPNIR